MKARLIDSISRAFSCKKKSYISNPELGLISVCLHHIVFTRFYSELLKPILWKYAP